MPPPKIYFPNKVWSGASYTRTDTTISSPPDSEDWAQIVREMRAMQEYILALQTQINALQTNKPGYVFHNLRLNQAVSVLKVANRTINQQLLLSQTAKTVKIVGRSTLSILNFIQFALVVKIPKKK